MSLRSTLPGVSDSASPSRNRGSRVINNGGFGAFSPTYGGSRVDRGEPHGPSSAGGGHPSSAFSRFKPLDSLSLETPYNPLKVKLATAGLRR